MTRDADVMRILEDLAAPFDPGEIRFRPQSPKGNRAIALAYVDSRCVSDRLDDAVGGENWQDKYDVLNDGSVVCHLSIRLGGEWVTKTDVGGQSEQPDGGDRLKAAFSDSFKRCAVKWGIARFLYRLPVQWVDYDPVKKILVGAPTLPDHVQTRPQPRQQNARPPALPPAPRPPAAAAASAQQSAPPLAATGHESKKHLDLSERAYGFVSRLDDAKSQPTFKAVMDDIVRAKDAGDLTTEELHHLHGKAEQTKKRLNPPPAHNR